MKISCPNCGQHLEGDESFVGLTVECPTCGISFQFQAEPKAAASEEPSATTAMDVFGEPSMKSGEKDVKAVSEVAERAKTATGKAIEAAARLARKENRDKAKAAVSGALKSGKAFVHRMADKTPEKLKTSTGKAIDAAARLARKENLDKAKATVSGALKSGKAFVHRLADKMHETNMPSASNIRGVRNILHRCRSRIWISAGTLAIVATVGVVCFTVSKMTTRVAAMDSDSQDFSQRKVEGLEPNAESAWNWVHVNEFLTERERERRGWTLVERRDRNSMDHGNGIRPLRADSATGKITFSDETKKIRFQLAINGTLQSRAIEKASCFITIHGKTNGRQTACAMIIGGRGMFEDPTKNVCLLVGEDNSKSVSVNHLVSQTSKPVDIEVKFGNGNVVFVFDKQSFAVPGLPAGSRISGIEFMNGGFDMTISDLASSSDLEQKDESRRTKKGTLTKTASFGQAFVWI